MKISRGIVVGLMLLGCAPAVPPAAPGPWAVIAEIPKARFSLDTTRIELHSGFVSAWIRVDWSEPQPLPSGTRYQTTTIRQELRCAEQVSRTRQMNAYMPGDDSTQFYVFPDTSWKAFDGQPLEEVYSSGACMLLSRLGKLPPA